MKKCCVIQVFWHLAVHHWLLVAVMQACVVYWIHHVVLFRIVVLNLLNKLSCIWLYTTVVYGCYTTSFGFFSTPFCYLRNCGVIPFLYLFVHVRPWLFHMGDIQASLVFGLIHYVIFWEFLCCTSYLVQYYISIESLFFERYSLITVAVCAYKFYTQFNV